MTRRRWRRKLSTWRSRLEYADWVMQTRPFPIWGAILHPFIVSVSVYAGFSGWEKQNIYTRMASEKSAAILIVMPEWISINMFIVVLCFFILPMENFFFPDKSKVLISTLVILSVAIFAFSGYEEYRFNRQIFDKGWAYCEHATRVHPGRWFIVYAQHREWCPRSREEIR